MRGEDSWTWLTELKSNPVTRGIPVLVATAVEDERKGYTLGADEYCLKPLKREGLLRSLERLTGMGHSIDNRTTHGSEPRRQALIIDDEAAFRYILAKLIEDQSILLRHAANGIDGLRLAKEIAPVFIFLDLDMPDISGFEVLESTQSGF